MANFNEHSLEMSIMELFQDEGYIYLNGEQIHRERSEVLLVDDLRKYLLNRYAAEGLTTSEVDSIVLRLRSISGTIYEANKAVCKMICDGFIFNREDHTKKDIYIELIDFDEPEKNVFKIVNQFEIEGVNNQLRIPDGIVFINGIPVVVLEFKSAVKENTTIMDAYTQLTVRYRRDIPELFKYNAFIVISDGANNKYGSFFSPYDFFYAWRKIEADDKELDGINSLVTMVSGLFRKERLLAVIKDFVYFPDSSDKDIKIVCRYPQYFAAVKLFENIKAHLRPEGDGKGGTYFGATGCGKSYTMLFLTRMLMNTAHIHNHIIMNSVNFETGQKFHQSAREMQQAKEYSNQLCREYGLSFTESKADPFRIPAWKKRLCRTIKEAMENCATREEFIAFMAEYGYKVRWEANQKYITYTTPENVRCRDNKLFDQTLLRSSMEAYFDMGGCEYLESRIDATEYGELLPTVDDAVCGLISILDAMNTGDNDRFHLETLHHSKQEIRRILERGGKIDRTVEYAVDNEEEQYEQYHGFSMRM